MSCRRWPPPGTTRARKRGRRSSRRLARGRIFWLLCQPKYQLKDIQSIDSLVPFRAVKLMKELEVIDDISSVMQESLITLFPGKKNDGFSWTGVFNLF